MNVDRQFNYSVPYAENIGNAFREERIIDRGIAETALPFRP